MALLALDKNEPLAKLPHERCWQGVGRSRGALNWVELGHWEDEPEDK
jgi:hypothetical protein